MKRLTTFRGLVAVAAAVAPLGIAHAYEENIISTAETGYFQQMAAMPKAPDRSAPPPGMHVVKNALGWSYVVPDNPAAGAQGPIREEINPEASAARAQDEALWRNFSPIIGTDRPEE